MTALYTAHSVNVYPDGAGAAVLIGGITDMSEDIATEVNSEETAGSYYAQNSNVKSQKPRLTFGTRDLKKAIDTIGLLGLSILGATNPGLEFWKAQMLNGVVKSGSSHRKVTMKNGRLMIRKISIAHQDDAKVECEAMPIYDGTNYPLIPAEGSALPGTPSDPARHTLGTLSIGGVSIDLVQNLEIDFGITLDALGGDSDVWDTQLLLSKVQPTITFTTLGPGLFLTSGGIPLPGLAGTQANSVIKLRKRANGATPFVADATEEHISINTAGILTIEKAFGSTLFKRGEMVYKFTSRFDGTNAPLVFDTTAAM